MIYKKVIAYCKKNNMTICSFEKMCEIGNGAIRKWKDGKSSPSLQTLAKIETATGIPVAEWIRDEKDKEGEKNDIQ